MLLFIIVLNILLLGEGLFAQQEWNLDFQRERKFKPFESHLIVDTTIYPLGDTLTIIQRPLLNIPAIATLGDTIKIEASGDTTTFARYEGSEAFLRLYFYKMVIDTSINPGIVVTYQGEHTR